MSDRMADEQLTPQDARLICDAHFILDCLLSEEEVEGLERNNPELLAAYEKLRNLAESEDA